MLYAHFLISNKWKWKALCLTLCDPMNCTFQAPLPMEFSRILEWVAVPFSRDLPNPGIEPRSPTLQADSLPSEPPWKPDFKQYYVIYMCVCMLSCVQLFGAPWTVACQAPLSIGFSRRKYLSGLSFPSPRDLSDPRIEPASPVSLALAGRFFTTEPPENP